MEDTGELYGSSAGNGYPFWANSHQHLDFEAVECFRRKLKYFFMNPCEKYKARGRKPWKLFLQIIKIAIITIQLVSFGLSNQMVVTFKEENLITFKHLFLKDYTDSHADTYAVYTQAEVYGHIDYVVDQLPDCYDFSIKVFQCTVKKNL
uniref:Mucolipin extracytosolic domain-containing protein n=1 Tax=Denticeps clupeoides TaxID=299321 RepID=A0AAY4DBN7_9TELE